MPSLFSAAARKKRKRAKRLLDASRRRVIQLFSRKRSGLTAAEQRSATHAVKRARFIALLPYVG